MTSFDVMRKCENTPVAKTQIIDVKGDVNENVYHLLGQEEHGLSVVYGFRDGKKQRRTDGKKELWETYAKRMHGEIKDIIRTNLGLDNNEQVTYETVYGYVDGRIEDRWFFFYLSEENVDATDLLYSLEKDGLSVRKVFQAVLSLHLKRFFVMDAKSLYPLKPVNYNSELYVNASQAEGSKKNGYYINALRPELYFGDEQDLCLSIKRVTFQAEKSDGFMAQTDETSLYFQSTSEGESDYKVLKRTDARKRQIPYMSFGNDYQFCVNYTENLMIEVLIAVLTTYKVPFAQRYFQANYVSDNFLMFKHKRELPLVIIDDLGEYEGDESSGREETFKQLKEYLNPIKIIQSSELREFELLRQDHAYLVLNRANANNSSIRNFTEEQRLSKKVEIATIQADVLGASQKSPKNKIYNTFWQALEDYEKNSNDHFDYYTSLKLASFKHGNTLVIQGLNIKKLEVEKKRQKKNKKNGEIKIESIPSVNTSKLDKIDTELWLKEHIRIHQEFKDINIPDSKLTLYKIRKTKGKSFLAYVVHVAIQNGSMKIGEVERYTEEQRLRIMHECLSEDVIPKLHNNSFYLYDIDNEEILSNYNTTRVPRIIGNRDVDSVEVGLYSSNGPGRSATNTVLPYYIAGILRKQYNHIHIQHINKDLIYFVSPVNKPNAKLAKQNLTYNIRVTDMNGKQLDPFKSQTTTVFLQSFTHNVHRVNEVSKSSILEKIVDSYLSN